MLSKLCIASASGTNRQDIATVPPHKKRTKKRGECGKNKKKEREKERVEEMLLHTLTTFQFPALISVSVFRNTIWKFFIGRVGKGGGGEATTHSAATCHH